MAAITSLTQDLLKRNHELSALVFPTHWSLFSCSINEVCGHADAVVFWVGQSCSCTALLDLYLNGAELVPVSAKWLTLVRLEIL